MPLDNVCVRMCDMSAAGSIMYEYATRLARDCADLKGVQGQAKCLLAAMNALRLGDPKFAWVTRPVTSGDDDEDEDDDSASPPKRPCGLAVADSVSLEITFLCFKIPL